MELPKSLISDFVKNVTNNQKTDKKETFMQGTIVVNDDGQYCVKLFDNSTAYMPVKMTTNIDTNRPVTVMIKNHTATIIGNTADVAGKSDTGIAYDTSALSIQPINKSDIEALFDNTDS